VIRGRTRRADDRTKVRTGKDKRKKEKGIGRIVHGRLRFHLDEGYISERNVYFVTGSKVFDSPSFLIPSSLTG
jgi:hypothetical protein